MSAFSRCLFVGFVLVVSVIRAHAQWDVNGPNAILTMQGSVPSGIDPIGHDVRVPVPGAFQLTIDFGANGLAGILLLAGISDPDGIAAIPTGLWGGQVDVGNGVLGNIVLVADGIGFSVNPTVDVFFRTNAATALMPTSTFTLTYGVHQGLCGVRLAWQAIVQDATNPPFFLDNTECGDLNLATGQDLVLLTGDDGVVPVTFQSGSSFPFHGVVYSDVWVSGNGFVCFGGPTSVALGGFSVDAVSFVNAEPAIAVCMTDWNITDGGILDGVFYSEFGATVRASWGDPRGLVSGAAGLAHFGDSDTQNQLDLTLSLSVDPLVNACISSSANEGAFTLTYPRFDPATVTRAGDGVIGHTAGGSAMSALSISPVSQDLLGAGFVLTGPAVPAIEEHDATGGNASVIGWDGASSARAYNEVRVFGGNFVTFLPGTSVVAGDLGYIGIPALVPSDDVLAIDVASVPSTGGTTITATGKFFGFGAGTVTLIDIASNAFPMLLPTVFGGSGPFFTNEGMTMVAPGGAAAGPATVRFNFASGYVESLPIFVTNSGINVGPTLTMPDDGFVVYPLACNTVTMYGIVYTELFICSNGTINMTAGHTDATFTLAEFFGGNGTVGNANVAYCWCDMNIGGTGTWVVTEDMISLTTTVVAASQVYSSTLSPAGSFTITFDALGPDSVTFDYSNAVNDIGNGDTAIFGYGDGIAQGGTQDTALTMGGFVALMPTYTTGTGGSTAPESIAASGPTGSFVTSHQAIAGGNFTIMNNGAGGLVIF